MAPDSSTLAWKIPWTEEPGGLQSMGSLGVGHDWATSLSLFTFMHWRRTWQPTPVFLPGESQGRGSLVGCHLWGRTEQDTTETTYSTVTVYYVIGSWCIKPTFITFYFKNPSLFPFPIKVSSPIRSQSEPPHIGAYCITWRTLFQVKFMCTYYTFFFSTQ